MVVDVGNGLRQIKRGKVVSGGQSLVKGFVNGEVQGMAETGLTDKKQCSERLAVHVGREKEAELLESEGGEEVSFVKDKKGNTAFAVDKIVESGSNTGHHLRTVEERLVA